MNIDVICTIYSTYKTLYECGDIERHEILPSSNDATEKDLAHYLYMTTAFNFQRNSLLCWKSAYDTYMDSDTRDVFYPDKTHIMDYDTLFYKLKKYKLIQMNKHIDVWIRFQNTFFTHYNYDIEALIQHYKTHKKDYPHLSGNKLGAYSYMICTCYMDYVWQNVHTIGIIPDTHIIQASQILGVCDSNNPQEVDKAWRPILQQYNFNPIYMHSALWRWHRKELII